ncbi:hypothetical protein V2K59_19335, partial [Pseudomonas alliivorans]|nr:hypothetical protein [Pseudomonas alliivorans]
MDTSLSRRERLHIVIFEADTPAGRRFDKVLLVLILLSLLVTIIVSAPRTPHSKQLTEARCCAPDFFLEL